MITCAANGCPSTQTTKIDGNLISFFAFPDDDLRKNQWLHNCNLASGVVSDKEPLHLCELHFEKINFTASRDLKSNAVPTLFGRIEEPPKKRKISENLSPTKASPIKQKKIDEHSHTLVTPPQSPFTQLTDTAEDPVEGNKTADQSSVNHAVAMNGSTTPNSTTHANVQTRSKTYRLMIQIDKMRSKPGPRCKKLVPFITLENNTKHLTTNEHEVAKKSSPSSQKPVKKACPKGNCKLKKCIYGSRPALQCELCDKYFITKREEDNYSCSICSKTFTNPQLLYIHIRKHFICDICQTECSSQMTFDKHVRLHVSTDPLYPYKCHQCAKIFDLKENVKQHFLTEHPKVKLQNAVLQVTSPTVVTKVRAQNDYRCVSCNISFQHDQTYRNHMSAHKRKESLRCNISETNNIISVPNPLTGSQIGILQPVKFSCRVCSKEFDNVGEVDVHTRTHLEDAEEGLNCKICKKSFKSNTAFSEHLKHHLSRAHPCPICSKAFINRTTLKIHLKTHPES